MTGSQQASPKITTVFRHAKHSQLKQWNTVFITMSGPCRQKHQRTNLTRLQVYQERDADKSGFKENFNMEQGAELIT